MNKNRITYIILSFIAGFLFTVFIYNLKVVLNLLYALYDNQILIHISVTIFYYYLFGILRKKLPYTNVVILLICVLTPIFIDASVLITNHDKIPMRFPFASIFPLLGSGLSLLKQKKRISYFVFSIMVSILFLFFSYKYIIPKISYYQFEKNSPKLSNNIFEQRFYTVNGNSILLSDTNKTKSTLIECFFKGCIPCEQKKKLLKEIKDLFPKGDLNIIFICDGSITPFNTFLEYNNINKKEGFTFLYDKDSVLSKVMKIKAYPFEILTKHENVVHTLMGFDETVSNEYFVNQIKRIKNIIYDSKYN